MEVGEKRVYYTKLVSGKYENIGFALAGFKLAAFRKRRCIFQRADRGSTDGDDAMPLRVPVLVVREIDPRSVLREFEYAHPVFDVGAIEAQRRVDRLQGVRRTWYCGAWTGYGFHEDGLKSGLDVARQLLEDEVPAWREAA